MFFIPRTTAAACILLPASLGGRGVSQHAKNNECVHALILQTAETSGRTMTPQELDLLGAVKQDAKMLEPWKAHRALNSKTA